MAEPHLDHPGEIHWFRGYAPSPVLGACPHLGCRHHAQSVIAWGPSLDRYELVQCDIPEHCDGGCRAWSDGHGRITTDWLQVEWAEHCLSTGVPAGGQP